MRSQGSGRVRLRLQDQRSLMVRMQEGSLIRVYIISGSDFRFGCVEFRADGRPTQRLPGNSAQAL